jgi:hypothetical protein
MSDILTPGPTAEALPVCAPNSKVLEGDQAVFDLLTSGNVDDGSMYRLMSSGSDHARGPLDRDSSSSHRADMIRAGAYYVLSRLVSPKL